MYIRHRTCAIEYGGAWEFCSARRACDLVFYHGGKQFGVTVPVCTSLRPRIGAFVITRVSADLSTWLLSSACFDRELDMCRSSRIHPDLPPLGFQLIMAPDNIGLELLEL